MDMNRRLFLKTLGFSVVAASAGLSGFTLLRKGVEASQVAPDPKALTGKRWGMVVDMNKFKTDGDITKCIEACHSIHNVPDIGSFTREIKWIWTEKFANAFPTHEHKYLNEAVEHMPFLVLCNHCDNPPCVRVCPTKATFRRADGLVMMDMHRCIGCRFCMAGCPYGARSFNWFDPRPYVKKQNPEYPTRMKGVVEKCTLCSERLAVGKIPACVEVSNGALVFGDLNDSASEIRKILKDNYTTQRKLELGTRPSVFYVIGGGEHA
ncbi:MAG TPA: 4Fe-4S dicluster domain-containing protein [Dissulfurispiraceae bacterium]|nr:4Fe-4S dicluster domain-containing protein [Dissulfurispiraceae bacterium]